MLLHCRPSSLEELCEATGWGLLEMVKHYFPQGKVHRKKSKKKLTSVSFMYVCVAENAELLVFFTFFLHLPHRQFSFRREVLNHHTPPPIPKLSSITKTRILFVFLPKKVPVFCLYFYKNEPVWRIRHTALSDFSLNPSIRQLLIHFSKFSMYAWGKKVKVLVFRECMYV